MNKHQTSSGDVSQEDQPNVATVVVGFDGSSGAMAALRWAYGEAKLRKAPLRVIHAISSFNSYPSIAVDVGAIHQHAAELLDTAVREVAGDDHVDGIDRLLFDGSAAKVLVTRSTTTIFSSSDLGATEASPASCLARSANSASNMRPVPSSSFLMTPDRDDTAKSRPVPERLLCTAHSDYAD